MGANKRTAEMLGGGAADRIADGRHFRRRPRCSHRRGRRRRRRFSHATPHPRQTSKGPRRNRVALPPGARSDLASRTVAQSGCWESSSKLEARSIFMTTADVVIIGGGIVGSSIAWHLTEAGCSNVFVLERETSQGKGSTGKSMGGVRAQFSTPINIRMSLHSIPFFTSFRGSHGPPSGYRPQGYLFVATTRAHGVSARELPPPGASRTQDRAPAGRAGCRAIAPELRPDDILGGSFCSTDGFVDPHSVDDGFHVEGHRTRCRALMRDTDVTGIRRMRAGVTRRGDFARLHRRPHGGQRRRRLGGQRRAPGGGGSAGRTAAPHAGAHRTFRQGCRISRPWWSICPPAFTTGRRAADSCSPGTIPRRRPGSRPNFDRGIYREDPDARGGPRCPALEEAEVNPKRAWAGLYEMTPDHHPVMGPVRKSRVLPGERLQRPRRDALAGDRQDFVRYRLERLHGFDRCETTRPRPFHAKPHDS